VGVIRSAPYATGLERVGASYGRHGSIVPLGEGMDFAVFSCDDLVLRVPKRKEGRRLSRRRYALLTALPADLPLAVPRPLGPPARAEGSGHGVLVYPLVPGTPLCDVAAPVDLANLGHALGRFLRALHAGTLREVAPPTDFANWADEARWRVPELVGLIGAELVELAVAALGADLPPVGPERVLGHRDLTDEHVLVDLETGSVGGVIDFGDAGPSPWWHDFVGIWTWGGEAALRSSCDAYGRHLDDDEQRLLKRHAVAVAVADVWHATRRKAAAEHLASDEVLTLSGLLRR
jgi:Ser/Thr protein kinase RdoA (MazF antagonist)